MNILNFKLLKIIVITLLVTLTASAPGINQPVEIKYALSKPVNTKNREYLSDLNQREPKIERKTVDKRAQILSAYLASKNSPLQDHAQDFIDAADTYNVNWMLVPSIAGVESTFGKRTPGNAAYPSYNGWGWGVYGDQALHFRSWRDGIFTVTEGLKKNYIDKGLDNPYEMNRIYASSPVWGQKVSYFMNDLEQFTRRQEIEYATELPTFKPFVERQSAGDSAKLAVDIEQLALEQ